MTNRPMMSHRKSCRRMIRRRMIRRLDDPPLDEPSSSGTPHSLVTVPKQGGRTEFAGATSPVTRSGSEVLQAPRPAAAVKRRQIATDVRMLLPSTDNDWR